MTTLQAEQSMQNAPNPNAGRFTICARDPQSSARAARLDTAHGTIETPTFMPVATQGTVKGVTVQQLREMNAQIILANTYHLSQRPGVEVIESLGGLQRFMGWHGPVLTDSGGYQVMSLTPLREVTDEGVLFRSHLDGRKILLTPESVIDMQVRMGVDILMPLDECVPAEADRQSVERAMRRTTNWAERSRNRSLPPARILFGLVQGGLFADLRVQHVDQLARLSFTGYAVGGLSVGEDRGVTREIAAVTAAAISVDAPRYLMGVGLPQDLLRFIAMGYDLFDCVLPTRNGRNGTVFTHHGRMNLRLARYACDPEPIDPSCGCPACRTVSRAYLRHLHSAGEMLGAQLATLHNLYFYLELMRQARAHVVDGTYSAWAAQTAAQIDEGEAL